jgi:DNA-binding MarR family transcriptional regulator
VLPESAARSLSRRNGWMARITTVDDLPLSLNVSARGTLAAGTGGKRYSYVSGKPPGDGQPGVAVGKLSVIPLRNNMLVFICSARPQTLTIASCLMAWRERVNFQQLKIIREAARRDYNLTEVANMLYTSQSGVSRHIRELEEELGIEIFIRRGKRLLGMTEPGKALLVIAERILNEASNVRRLADLSRMTHPAC